MKISNIISDRVSSFFEYCEQIIVCVSGGADSMTLLHCLKNSNKNFQLVVMHLNHCLRGFESDCDEFFVQSWCKQNDVRFLSKKVDILNLSRNRKESIELVGRLERYRFFKTVGGKIATAHSLSDRVETMFINILRGCGLKGLISIPNERGRIIRPLIDFTRAEIEEYCKENDLVFRTDSSNLSDKYLRNRIRHKITKEFLNLDLNFEKKFLKSLTFLEKDECYLLKIASENYEKIISEKGLFLEKLNKLDYPIKIRVLAMFLNASNISVTNNMLNRILRLCTNLKGRQSLPNKKYAKIYDSHLVIEKEQSFLTFDYILPKYGKVFHKNIQFIRYNVGQIPHFSSKFQHLFIFKVDCDKLIGDIHFRTRMAGDRIKLFKRPRKSLKDLMWEKKMPIRRRNETLVLSDDCGPFWVENFGVDVRVMVTEKSENLLVAIRTN